MNFLEPKPISTAPNFYDILSKVKASHSELKHWSFDRDEPVLYKTVDLNSQEGVEVQQLFRASCYSYKITSLQLIQNPYLMTTYLQKKEMKNLLKCDRVERRWLFHGTKRANMGGIAMDNFQRRLCKTHKFGWGVSFTPDAYYASHYSDKLGTKQMILSRVITGKVIVGKENMVVPNGDFDTSMKSDGKVLVKYDDDTFYPTYLITFTSSGVLKKSKKPYYDDFEILYGDYEDPVDYGDYFDDDYDKPEYGDYF